MAFYFNQEDCIGCRTCQVACKDKNNLSVGIFFRHIRSFEVGDYPNPNRYHYSQTCNHCSSPACVVNCPTGVLFIADDKTVQQDIKLCIACRRCINACPYGAPKLLEFENVVIKCDACADLRAYGELPACVAACNMRVLEFGDREELASKHSGENLVSDLPFLPSSSKTSPNTIIKARACALESDYREHLIV